MLTLQNVSFNASSCSARKLTNLHQLPSRPTSPSFLLRNHNASISKSLSLELPIKLSENQKGGNQIIREISGGNSELPVPYSDDGKLIQYQAEAEEDISQQRLNLHTEDSGVREQRGPELRQHPMAGLQTMPGELHRKILSYVPDELTSTCLGLTCKRLYDIHKSTHPKVHLTSCIRIPTECGPTKFLYLIWLLVDWLGGIEGMTKLQLRYMHDILPSTRSYKTFTELKTTESRRIADYWELAGYK